MKQIQCKSFNREEDVVGRNTIRKKLFNRSKEIWVSKDASSPIFGYAATITTNENIVKNHIQTIKTENSGADLLPGIEKYFESTLKIIEDRKKLGIKKIYQEISI
mgnify:CR=1 FL=1